MAVIGIDVGTNGVKAALVDADGRVLREARRAYGLRHIGEAGAEQSASDWLEKTGEAVRELDARGQAEAVSLSTQGGATVAVDEAGLPLADAISWMDARSVAQARALASSRTEAEHYAATGMTPSTGVSIAHIAWMRETRPELFRRARRFLTTCDFLNLRLAGRAAMDPTNALMTGMLNIEKGDWDEFALHEAGVTRERLARIEGTGARVGGLTAEGEKLLGLRQGTPVFNGAHDQYACALGCGAIHPGDFMLSGGTAWVLLGAFGEPVRDKTRTLTPGRHALSGVYGAFYAISVGSAALNWLLDAFAIPREALPAIGEEAAARISKNRGLFFYPYLNGGTGVTRDDAARGVFAGLSLSSDRYDMALAVMEGVAFETARALRLFEANGCAVKALRMFGGASKSALWTGILAAVCQRPVLVSDMTEAAEMGAAALAGIGCGLYADAEQACARFASHTLPRETRPDPSLARHYAEKLARYERNLASALAFRKSES